MASRKQLIDARQKELLAMGYMPGIVEKAMDWAVGCADGMAGYASKMEGNDPSSSSREQLMVKFLPQYLNDSETWIRSFGHQPGERRVEA